MDEGSVHLGRVRAVSAKYNLRLKKRLGQHFLLDHNVLSSIAKACELDRNDYVVEIGAGIGALTGYLAQEAKGVLAIEVDTELCEPLKEVLAGRDNVKTLFGDILKLNIEREIKQAFSLAPGASYKVCGNLPYYITTPIIFHLLATAPSMRWAVLMVQREVAERMLAPPGTKDYGMLTVMVRYQAEVEMVRRVPPNCFRPRPEVDSAVIRVTPRRERPWAIRNEDAFKGLVKEAFQRRRKTIHNIVAEFFGVDKAGAAQKLGVLGVEPNRRPETLDIREFGKIADAFSEQEAQ